jgi:uncharacterized protein (TIGR02453 family)
MAFFNSDFLQFFRDLAPNNNKDWFDANRSRYENNIREPFKAFVDHMISELSTENPRLKDLQNKECIFRINRDIRFSKDKTPYKMKVSALINVGGKKNYLGEGIYIELGPEHLRIYGGLYQLDKESLLEIREGIAANPKEFKKLYSENKFERLFGTIRGDQNKILPKELKAAGEIEPLIFNKQFYYFAEYSPEKILDKDLDKVIINAYQTAQPIEHFFSKIIKR